VRTNRSDVWCVCVCDVFNMCLLFRKTQNTNLKIHQLLYGNSLISKVHSQILKWSKFLMVKFDKTKHKPHNTQHTQTHTHTHSDTHTYTNTHTHTHTYIHAHIRPLFAYVCVCVWFEVHKFIGYHTSSVLTRLTQTDTWQLFRRFVVFMY